MRSFAIAVLLAAVPATDAWAESLWIGGASLADTTRVAYLGRVAPLPGRSLADGWSQSVFVDRVQYEYPLGNQTIEGTAEGIKWALGREYRVSGGYIGTSVGAAFRRTRLSPDDPGNRSRGEQIRAVLELQWRSDDSRRWKSSFYGNYVVGARSNAASVFVGRRLDAGFALGVQLASNGDPSYRIWSAAVAANGWRLGEFDVGVFAGAEHADGGDTRPAVGFGIVRFFAE